MTRTPASNGPVVLFDGVCNLCHRSVRFVLAHERERAPKLRFAPLQSAIGRALAGEHIKPEGDPDSIVLVEEGAVHVASGAALRIARHLRAPYRWASVLLWVPRPLRDFVYHFIARHRYRWFGRNESCALPTPSLRDRFLA